MEATAPSLAYMKLTNSLCFSTFPSPSAVFLPSHCSISASHSFTFLSLKSFQTKQPQIQLKARNLRNFRPVNASDAEITSSDNAEKWLLEPVGDGDSRHIGFKVPMPDAFEIALSVVTVGRLPEKADMVIPVATVSGLHARIEKKEESLLVTDLDSTNGTFIGEKKLRPGAMATVSPGSYITFGDTHLAKFRVSKLDNVEVSNKTKEPEVKLDTNASADNLQSTS